MIQKLVEEKVRGIFYGNPTDLFVGSKVDIGFGNYFKSNHLEDLSSFAEITARRNIIIHNQGRVDRKYLSEVAGSEAKLGEALPITEDYLRDCLLTMKGLASFAAQKVATNVYKEPLHGKAEKIRSIAKRAATSKAKEPPTV